MQTLRTTAMLMFVITGAWIFSFFIVQTQLPLAIVDLIQYLQVPPFAVVLIILSFYLVLGCFLESVAIILVTVPVFLPIIQSLGFDSVWYGILMVIMVEVGLIARLQLQKLLLKRHRRRLADLSDIRERTLRGPDGEDPLDAQASVPL